MAERERVSYKSAVSQHCKDCSYDSAVPGTWRDQVERCEIRSCALWPVRPVTAKTRRQRRADKKVANEIPVKEIDDLKSDE